MNDFISREDTIDKMQEVDWYHQNKNGEMVHGANSSEHQAWYKAEDVYKVLEDMPSAQPEREKGEWIWCGDKHVCSECDEFALCDAYDVLETGEYQEDLSDFCPHCGADMRGEQE